MAATATHVASGNGVTSPLVLTASVSGDLVLIVTKDGAGTLEIVTGVTDSAGGTWTLRASAPSSGTVGRRVEVWTKLASAAITSVSVAYTGSATPHGALVQLSGLDAAPFDTAAATFQSTSTAPTELTITPAVANELLISVCQGNSNTQVNHFSEAGWTRGTTGANGPAWAWRNDQPAGVATGCAWTLTTAQGTGQAIIAFKPNTTPAAPTVTVWNGTSEVAATVTLWDGTTETAVTVEQVT